MFGNTTENDLAKLLYNATPIPNIADNAASAPLTNFHVALHTADPGEAGDQTTSEAAYTSYTRVAVARTSGGWTVTNNVVTNTADVAWPQCTGGSATITHFSVGVASSSTSKIINRGVFGSALGPFTGENSNDQITNKGHGLSVDDRVCFYAPPNATLPTGITEGTVYFVKSVADVDNITISATQGGATLDITADGDGVMFKVVPLSISSGIIPRALAGQISITVD